ncbi:MAG: bacterial Ig-like domain-containing protein [Acholeplasmataceae bacterium]|nr:bacterial Ig-like domain-containing protein [Acholeplasmataceae bacterium]
MKRILSGLVMMVFVAVLAACVQPVSEVESLEVTGLDTSGFVEGQANVDISGAEVIVTFADQSTQTLGIDDVTVTGNGLVTPGSYLLDMSTAGSYTITVSYGGVTVNINYVVAVQALVADTSWYDGQSSPFYISTAEELAGLAVVVNAGTDDFLGDTVYLDADIDLGNAPWTPVGTAIQVSGGSGTDQTWFAGTFDGQDFTISNLKINAMYDSYQGFFGVVHGATVTDVNFDGVNILGYEHVAVVAAKAVGGSDFDLIDMNNVVVIGGHWVAGVIGYSPDNAAASGTVSNSTLTDAEITAYVLDMQANGDKAGGITGYTPYYTITGNSVTNLVLDIFRDGAGITGIHYDLSKVTNNTVTNAELYLDKTQTENPNFKDGEKDQNRFIAAIVGRWSDGTPDAETPNGEETLGAGNTHTGVQTFIRLEDEEEFLEYLTKTVGRKRQTWYTLVS